MSSDNSSSEVNTKVYKLKNHKNFAIWRDKIMSKADTKGYRKYLLGPRTVATGVEIEIAEAKYINETDDKERRKFKSELHQAMRERKKIS